MENEDKNTDYLKFVIVEDQKRGIADIVIGIIFFLLETRTHYFLYREFSSPPEKNHHHLKCQFPPRISV